MTKWKPNWELDSVPDEKHYSEHGRRQAQKRTTFAGGRKPVLRPCFVCGRALTATERRGKCPTCGWKQPKGAK